MKPVSAMAIMVAALFLTLFTAQPSWAQQEAEATDELVSLVGKALVDEVTQANEDVKKAKEILDIILKEGTAEEQEEAIKDVEDAEARCTRARNKLDTARLDALSEQCGKSADEIQAMRDSGMGWGRIAKECGVHPSVSGKGNGKMKSKGKGKNQ